MKNPVFALAPDSFKGSMTAKEVCNAMEMGIRRVFPDAVCIKIPMADGGEGTVQSLVDAVGGTIYVQKVTGPAGAAVDAQYGILGDGETAVIEMAAASGLYLIDESLRNPYYTTTYGTGELVKVCLDKGIKRIILGMGGSATNDGGCGFAQALGARFLDEEGNELPFGGKALKKLYKIDVSGLDKRLNDIEIEVASDVTNPLCGKLGASYVFGKQKGATPEMMEILDEALAHYSDAIKSQLGKDVKDIPGAGAAGGLGAGLLAFTNAKLVRGIDIAIDYTHLQEKIRQADIVFTGEGSINSQTCYGKVPYGVALLAKQEGKRVIAVTGNLESGTDTSYFDAVFPILPKVMGLNEALSKGRENVENTMENIAKLMLMGRFIDRY